MVHEARVKMRREGSYVEAVTGEARFLHISGDHEHCLAVLRAEDGDQIERILQRCSHFLDPDTDVLDREEDWLVARCSCPAYGSAQAIREEQGTIVWPIVVHDGFSHYHIVAASRERLQAVLARLEAMGTLVVERIAQVSADTLDVSLPVSSITSRMSQRQLEALRRAVDEGYYQRPRATSADALAEEMDVARSTYQEHLRKAEQVVMETFAGLVAEHPALAAGATRGPGRPPADIVEPGGHLA